MKEADHLVGLFALKESSSLPMSQYKSPYMIQGIKEGKRTKEEL